METLIAIVSLVIAALAVFVGPALQLSIARKQMKITLAVAKRQIVSPIGQKWIDDLRCHVAELLSAARGNVRVSPYGISFCLFCLRHFRNRIPLAPSGALPKGCLTVLSEVILGLGIQHDE